MFNAPRYVLKAGQLLISNHEFVSDYTDKKVLRVAPEYDQRYRESYQAISLMIFTQSQFAELSY